MSDTTVVRELRTRRLARPLPVRVAADQLETVTEAQVVMKLRAAVRDLGLRDLIEVLPLGEEGPAVDVRLSVGTDTVPRVALPVDLSSVRVVAPNGLYERPGGPTLLVNDIFVAVAFVLSNVGATALAARRLAGTAQGSLLSTMPAAGPQLAAVMREHGLATQTLGIAISLWNAVLAPMIRQTPLGQGAGCAEARVGELFAHRPRSACPISTHRQKAWGHVKGCVFADWSTARPSTTHGQR